MSQEKKSKLLSVLNTKKKIAVTIIGLIVIILLFVIGVDVIMPNKKPVITTVSTLEEIIKISELSTYTSVYNGIAKVYNKDDNSRIDYYISYEAKVNAGIDFKQVKVSADEQNKKITITIPEIKITDISVDAGSMDFMFVNEKANKETVSSEALKACEADVKKESEEQNAILELAHKNAENVLKALTMPIIDKSLSEWTLEIV